MVLHDFVGLGNILKSINRVCNLEQDSGESKYNISVYQHKPQLINKLAVGPGG